MPNTFRVRAIRSTAGRIQGWAMNVCAHPPETPAPHTKTVAIQGRIKDGPGGAVNTLSLGLTTNKEWL